MKQNVMYLDYVISNSPYPVVVLTHHLPSNQLTSEKFKNSPFNPCFSLNCEFLIRPPVVAWIYGHSHEQNIKTINNINLFCNPIGYPNENPLANYERCFFFYEFRYMY